MSGFWRSEKWVSTKSPETGTIQAAKFYLITCVTSSPNPSLPLCGFVRGFHKFIVCLAVLLGYEKAEGLWFIFVGHRARSRIITYMGNDEFHTNHICVKDMWKARNTHYVHRLGAQLQLVSPTAQQLE